jgi:RNA polymerase-binding transcription factor DksA
MVAELYERIQVGLAEKQKEITEFLEVAPETEKEICCAEDECCVDEHLQVIETSLEKIEEETLGICVVCHGHIDAQLLEMDYTANVCLEHYSDEERRNLRKWNSHKSSAGSLPKHSQHKRRGTVASAVIRDHRR